MMKFIIYISVLVILFFTLISSCAVNPVTGKKEFMLLSESDEIKMGQQADKQVVQMYGIYADENIAEYIDNLGQKMAKISHRPHLKYEFKVMDSPIINAFAVPGGYVYLTRGILSYLNSEAELAGVMGHEIGHVTARHSAQKYSETSLAQLGLGVGSMISEEFASFAGLAAQGLGLLFLRFSRDDERQSDDLGVEYATKIGYDAGEMANFFKTLDKMGGDKKQGGLPDWFSTHPNPADRVIAVQNESEKIQKKLNTTNLKINRDVYLNKINGLIFGENPRQGFVDNAIFYHPDMKFQFPIPADWKVTNLPSQVQIISPDEKGIIVFSLSETKSYKTAADQFISKFKASVAKDEVVKVNGLPARKVFSEISDGSNVLRVQSYFIEKSGRVFVFHGFAQRGYFDSHQISFSKTMMGFQQLKDKLKLNIQPDRIQIKKVSKAGTLNQVLKSINIADDKREETALLNGRALGDRIEANTLIKTIVRGN